LKRSQTMNYLKSGGSVDKLPMEDIIKDEDPSFYNELLAYKQQQRAAQSIETKKVTEDSVDMENAVNLQDPSSVDAQSIFDGKIPVGNTGKRAVSKTAYDLIGLSNSLVVKTNRTARGRRPNPIEEEDKVLTGTQRRSGARTPIIEKREANARTGRN